MTRSLVLSALSVRNLRNLASVEIETGPRFNILAGDNGQGKTNLLEAVYVLCTSRSFRASRPGDLVQHGQAAGSVRGVFIEEGIRREQSAGLEPGKRHVRVDGKRPATLIDYALRTPAVVFHPGELDLSMGGGTERRKLLDRTALHLGTAGASAMPDYVRALRERQRALETRGELARDLDEWEALLVTLGSTILTSRRQAAARLSVAARQAFARIAPQGIDLDVTYAPGAPEDAATYAEALRTHRRVDARRGSAKVGPHRDDLALTLAGHPVRGVASQGQHRAVVLALKSAEVEVIASARGVRPLLLLDDVSSELDRARTAALFTFLQEQEGQVFLTTTRPELVDTGKLASAAYRLDFRVEAGGIRLSQNSAA